jgi:hypothetical protein
MSYGLIMALSSVCLILVAAFRAYLDGALLPKQMSKKYPGFSFSFFANGAMWGNLILLSLALLTIGNYADEWSSGSIALSLGIGMLVSLGTFHFVYLWGEYPDSLVGAPEKNRCISPAGWVIVFYSNVVLAALILFYYYSSPTAGDAVWVGVLLALYIPVANHVPLAFLNSRYFFPWCPPDILEGESAPVRFIIGGEILVIAATVVKLLG